MVILVVGVRGFFIHDTRTPTRETITNFYFFNLDNLNLSSWPLKQDKIQSKPSLSPFSSTLLWISKNYFFSFEQTTSSFHSNNA